MTGSILYEDLPKNMSHPDYPIAIVRIARLAVGLSLQGQGIGSRLLYDALKRHYPIYESIGVFAIVVDSKDVDAAKFYE